MEQERLGKQAVDAANPATVANRVRDADLKGFGFKALLLRGQVNGRPLWRLFSVDEWPRPTTVPAAAATDGEIQAGICVDRSRHQLISGLKRQS